MPFIEHIYKTSTKENWDKYKEAPRSLKRTLHKSMRESWQDFCSKIETVHEPASVKSLAWCTFTTGYHGNTCSNSPWYQCHDKLWFLYYG